LLQLDQLGHRIAPTLGLAAASDGYKRPKRRRIETTSSLSSRNSPRIISSINHRGILLIPVLLCPGVVTKISYAG
jgi:hypothetical protein